MFELNVHSSGLFFCNLPACALTLLTCSVLFWLVHLNALHVCRKGTLLSHWVVSWCVLEVSFAVTVRIFLPKPQLQAGGIHLNQQLAWAKALRWSCTPPPPRDTTSLHKHSSALHSCPVGLCVRPWNKGLTFVTLTEMLHHGFGHWQNKNDEAIMILSHRAHQWICLVSSVSSLMLY